MESRVNETLPADEGHDAFRAELPPSSNPYEESDWRHKEWQFGRDCEEQSAPDAFDWETETFKD